MSNECTCHNCTNARFLVELLFDYNAPFYAQLEAREHPGCPGLFALVDTRDLRLLIVFTDPSKSHIAQGVVRRFNMHRQN